MEQEQQEHHRVKSWCYDLDTGLDGLQDPVTNPDSHEMYILLIFSWKRLLDSSLL